jgi:hypothetical protein
MSFYLVVTEQFFGGEIKLFKDYQRAENYVSVLRGSLGPSVEVIVKKVSLQEPSQDEGSDNEPDEETPVQKPEPPKEEEESRSPSPDSASAPDSEEEKGPLGEVYDWFHNQWACEHRTVESDYFTKDQLALLKHHMGCDSKARKAQGTDRVYIESRFLWENYIEPDDDLLTKIWDSYRTHLNEQKLAKRKAVKAPMPKKPVASVKKPRDDSDDE